MSCKLLRDIRHSCRYNSGGIKDIYLLDIRDFVAYKYLDDKLYNSCYIDRSIEERDSLYYLLDVVEASNFTEDENEYGMYTQKLTTFIHTLGYRKTSDLLLASKNKYVVVFRTYQDTLFSFGSDRGANIEFSQITGQTGEATGYGITITKNSIYPLMEVNSKFFNKLHVLGTENRIVVLTENKNNAILTEYGK
jgi:hypothetical protein